MRYNHYFRHHSVIIGRYTRASAARIYSSFRLGAKVRRNLQVESITTNHGFWDLNSAGQKAFFPQV